MLKILMVIPTLIFLTACSHNHYTLSDITSEVNERSEINRSGEGVVRSYHGEHRITVNDIVYNVNEINLEKEAINISASGLVKVTGAPYTSSPSFIANIHGKATLDNDGILNVYVQKTSSIKLQGISDLHLYGIRDKVKDIVAMTLIEKSDIKVHGVHAMDGKKLKIWRF